MTAAPAILVARVNESDPGTARGAWIASLRSR